jgi:hypothetical protein
VGLVEISDAQTSQRTWFAADEAQASVQQKKMRPELVKLVEVIYSIGARLLNQRSIKP